MKTSTVFITFLSLVKLSVAFQHSARKGCVSPRSTSSLRMVYVPDGFTKESYAKFKEEERKKNAKKNLGGVGPKGFRSRSMQSFQEALERGEAQHLLPVFNAKERLAKGELKLEDIPYMQRGGAWDNSDVKGAKRKKWLASDKEYADGGFKKEQSVSIFGKGEGLDWTGTRSRTGPSQPMKNQPEEKKKFFGLF